MIVLDVLGKPAPKGSARAMLINGHARLIASSSAANEREQRQWHNAIRDRVEQVLGPVVPHFIDVALQIEIEFRLERPVGHFGTGKNAGKLKPSSPRVPTVYPDIDKLARCTLDALTGRVFDDDSRIVKLIATKVYAEPGAEGARIAIEKWTDDHDTLQSIRSQLSFGDVGKEPHATVGGG